MLIVCPYILDNALLFLEIFWGTTELFQNKGEWFLGGYFLG